MAYFRYSTVSNELLEISDFPLSPGDNEACSEVTGLTRVQLEQYAWDPVSCYFLDSQRRRITKREFLKKFTPQEYATIKGATIANDVVDYYWQLFMVADYIDLNDTDVITGIGALEQMGLLASGRAAEILT